jgi:hypothetical protein
MGYSSITDEKFLSTLKSWFQSQSEISMLVRYSHAGGSREFTFHTSFEDLTNRLGKLPPRASVIVFRQPQLPLRGVVDDAFIAKCLSSIPDGVEYLVVDTVQRVAGKGSWFHFGDGESHGDLREELENLRNDAVAAGLYPPWFEDTAEVISAAVPDADGVVRSGVY